MHVAGKWKCGESVYPGKGFTLTKYVNIIIIIILLLLLLLLLLILLLLLLL